MLKEGWVGKNKREGEWGLDSVYCSSFCYFMSVVFGARERLDPNAVA